MEASDTWARVTDRGRFERGLLERTGAGWVLRARWPVGDLSGSLTTDSAAAQALREGWRSASTARPRHCASADDRASVEDAGERALGARPRAYRTGEGGLALLRGGPHGLCAIARAQPLGEWRVMKVFSPGAAPKLETSLRWPDEPAALAELVAGSAGDRPIERIELLDLGVFIRRYCR